MTGCNRGDIVLVGFVFSEESGTKLRPALVISSQHYHRARQEVVVAAITSNVTRRLLGDHLIADWKGAGLLFPSLVTGIFRTIKRTMIAIGDLESCRNPTWKLLTVCFVDPWLFDDYTDMCGPLRRT